MTVSAAPGLRHLGIVKACRRKRLESAIALRKRGWIYAKIADHLFMIPKTIMRDIKCFAINPIAPRNINFTQTLIIHDQFIV